ncbi:hypothetical protein FVR03_02695 [Pontibacter qinzhouensis]|uniref:Addiction module protein n=1 Tax=Pontibacter qinzhouensis TaxID=2603253 RepID=A0A5C8KEI1_9BACT|nr:hypothetical protein [Pontibacter qinzhouensis]TXK52006.1 hypothetical protein FVR03_02695 [Pontibacter qinzhouensis]
MKTKEKIIERINQIDDESVLEELLEIIDLELNLSEATVQLTDEQKAAIDEGMHDLAQGRSYSDEEARKIVNEWMAKK